MERPPQKAILMQARCGRWRYPWYVNCNYTNADFVRDIMAGRA
jgi:hypothetical protein